MRPTLLSVSLTMLAIALPACESGGEETPALTDTASDDTSTATNTVTEDSTTASDTTAVDTVASDTGAATAVTETTADSGPTVPNVGFDQVWAQVVYPSGCSGGYCHGSVMNDRDRILNRASDEDCGDQRWVVPGKPEESLLWRKINPGTSVCGDKMPKDGDPLSQAQADLVYQWILQGAL
jgi:hypothetical protein